MIAVSAVAESALGSPESYRVACADLRRIHVREGRTHHRIASSRSPCPRSLSRLPTAPPSSSARARTATRENQTTAPTPAMLRQMTPEAIFNSLTLGRMQMQAISLSEAEQRAVVGVPGRQTVRTRRCRRWSSTSARHRRPCARRPAPASGTGGAATVANTRYQKNGGLTAADLPKLKLKWAFGYHTVTSARAQPTIAGGRLFVASENGEVHALDPKTGCTHWTFRAQAGVRNGHGGRPLQERRPGRAGGVLRRRARERVRRGRAAPASRSGFARLTSTGRRR